MVQNKKRLVSLILMLTLLVASVAALGISASAEEGSYELVTNAENLSVGDKVVIVANTKNFALSTTQNNNNRGQAAVTKNGDSITFGSGVQILTLEAGKSAGTFAFYTGSGYLYAASSSNNYLRTETTLSANSSWSISITNAGVATIKAQGNNSRNLLKYNSSSSIFACYASGQLDVSIYKLVESTDSGETVCKHTNTTTTTNAATCTVGGSTVVTCNDCGTTVSSTPITAPGHTYVDGACSVCGEEEPDELTKTYTFSDYTAGTQYAEGEVHRLDEYITVTTTQCHFTSELRIYSSSTNNGYAIISSDRVFTKLGFNAGNNADTINVYGSTDGSTWTLISGVAVASSYKDYTVEISETLGYKYLKLDVAGTKQVRVKSITVTTVPASAEVCEHAWAEEGTVVTSATCTTNGVEKVACTLCDEEMERAIPATGHTYSEEGEVKEAAGCTTTGTMKYPCTNDGCEEYNEVATPATGHDYVDGECAACGKKEINLSGMYYIAAIRENENYQYMTSDLGTANTKRYQIVDSGLTELPESVEYTTDALQVFILEKAEGADKYYIYAVGATTDECYLGWSTGNSGKLVEKEDAIAFTVDVNDDGTYNIHFTASDGERTLALNENSDYDYFAMYKSGQCQNLSLVPVDFCCKFLGAGIRFQEYVDGELTDCPTDAVDIRFGWKFFKGEDVEFSWSWDYRLGDNGTEVTGQKGQFITEDLVTNAVFTNVSYNNLAKSIYIKINVTVNGTTYAAADYETRTVLAVLEVLASGDNNATSYAKSVLYAYDPDEYVAYAPSKEESAE